MSAPPPLSWTDAAQVRQNEQRYLLRDIVRQRERTVALARAQPGEVCLDVGCGQAFLLQLLAEAVGPAGAVHGVDVSDAMLRAARARCPAARLANADAQRLPFDADTFDLVTAVQVLVYVPDPLQALREMCRVLKPGGRLVVLDSVWSQAVWNVGDVELQRRVLTEFDKHCLHPLLPMRLPGLIAAAGFTYTGTHAIPIINTEWTDDNWGTGAVARVAEYVQGHGLLPAAEVQRWVQDVERHGKAGSFFFCLNRYVYLATKPPRSRL